jgi:hypothetical protein
MTEGANFIHSPIASLTALSFISGVRAKKGVRKTRSGQRRCSILRQQSLRLPRMLRKHLN